MRRKRKRAAPIIIHAGIVIREVGPGRWQTDVHRQGHRARRVHPDVETAKRHAEELAIQIKNEGAGVLSLTQAQRLDASAALDILNAKTTLTDAARYWMKHNAIQDGMTLSELSERWLSELRRRGCRDTTLGERTQKLTRLCADYGDRPAASLARSEIISWMDAWHLTGATADGYRRCFNALYGFALAEQIVETSPVAGIRAFKTDERLPTPFTVEAVERILHAAERYAPVMVPTLAVQFFGGLRPGEAMGLTWQDIDFDEGHIRVRPEVSKVRRSRNVEMNDALVAWLAPHRKASGPIGYSTKAQFSYFVHVKPIDSKRGLLNAAAVKWIQDGPRKTFASAHYAMYGDAAKLAAILGHAGQDVLFRHYRGLYTKKQAARYWAMRPSASDADVIPFVGVA